MSLTCEPYLALSRFSRPSQPDGGEPVLEVDLSFLRRILLVITP